MNSNIYLWNISNEAKAKILKGHREHVNSVEFSPDGQLLASGCGKGTVRLWDTSTGTMQRTLKTEFNRVQSVAFSPNGKFLVSGSSGRAVRLWNLSTGKMQQTLRGHGDWVNSVRFSSDGRFLASGSSDKMIKLWDPTFKPRQQKSEHPEYIQSMDFSPDGKFVGSGSTYGIVKLWNTVTGTLEHTFINSLNEFKLPGNLNSPFFRNLRLGFVKYSPDGKILASGNGDYRIHLWNTKPRSFQKVLNCQNSRIGSIVFSTDGRSLLSVSFDGTVRVWDIATRTILQAIKHSSFINSVAISPDGSLIASNSDSTTSISFFGDSVTGSSQITLQGSEKTDSQGTIFGTIFEKAASVAFAPDGGILAVGFDGVQLWDVVIREIIQTLEHRNVQSVAFSSDGELLASSSYGKTIKVWDVSTGDLLQSLNIDALVTDLAFSKNGSQLITNLGSFNVHPWRYDNGNSSNTAETNTEVFIRDGQWIAVNGENVVWLPPEYRPICSVFKDGILALALESEVVSMIKFRV